MSTAETRVPQVLSEDEIERAIKLHGEAAWDLIQAGVIDPASLETKQHGIEEVEPRHLKAVPLGAVALHETSDRHESLAA